MGSLEIRELLCDNNEMSVFIGIVAYVRDLDIEDIKVYNNLCDLYQEYVSGDFSLLNDFITDYLEREEL